MGRSLVLLQGFKMPPGTASELLRLTADMDQEADALALFRDMTQK